MTHFSVAAAISRLQRRDAYATTRAVALELDLDDRAAQGAIWDIMAAGYAFGRVVAVFGDTFTTYRLTERGIELTLRRAA